MDQNRTSVDQHLEILGAHMKDIVTGLEGMVDSVAFDTYGCVQATLRGKAKKDGTIPASHWFDVKRLELTGKQRVMDVPAFVDMPIGTEAGPAEKPALD